MPRLSDRVIRAIREPGRYGDGEGLYLEVGRTTGARSWMLRVTAQGRRRDIGLGGYPDVSLAVARERARDLRKIAKAGGDPLAAKKAVEAEMTFEEAARTVYGNLKPGWRQGGVHVRHWISSLEIHALPVLGTKPVGSITGDDVLGVLLPIWFQIPETARRVRQRIRAVMAWAKSSGRYHGENPVDTASGALPRNQEAVKAHHPAMPYVEVPTFMAHLAAKDAMSALALRFLILTAARSGEVRGATWGEIDIDGRVWTIPGSRMKAKRPHRAPLSAPAVAILGQVRGLDDMLVFPGKKLGRPLSDVALAKQVRGYGTTLYSVHGMRSSFRDWAAERTNVAREIAELCLAHEVGDAIERAYLRSDLLDKRRDLLEQWAAFCTGEMTKVVELRA